IRRPRCRRSCSIIRRPSTSRRTTARPIGNRKGPRRPVSKIATRVRPRPPAAGESNVIEASSGISPRFLSLLAEEHLGDKRILDLGSGWGRVALALAPCAAHVVGLERDPALVREARRRAAAAGLQYVEFETADVEREEYDGWVPDVITAHLCASDAIIER